ncbi:MAG: response regulator [Desulfobacteraceae bacterium]|nr:MAG: response regulator [Desulfobacteraceae bacterium]
MTLKLKNEAAFEALRKQAEQVIDQRGAKTADGVELEMLRLLNEIEVYQVELELQNQELNRSTKELEAARNDYFELYDSAPVAFVTVNSQGMIERVNKAAARLLAQSGNLLEESLFARAVHPADQGAFFSYLNVTDKKRSSCEMRLRGKEDQPLWVRFMARSVFDAQKGFKGWRLAIIDVTERKQQELSLQKAQGELERRAAQLARLSLELTMAEQRERRRMAEMMHDHLQQLLAGARLNLDIASAETVADQAPAFKNAYDLILQSMEAARMLSTELSPPVLFRQGLPEAFGWLARWMKKTHALDVEIQIDEEDYPVEEAIKVLLFQSVRELLFNVKKHARTDSARVAMTTEGAMIKVVVSDNGSGFEPQHLEQSDCETDKGFGLFSVRERLVLLKGTFEIESSPDSGTTVTLTAPMHTGAFTQPQRRVETVEDVSQERCAMRRPRRESANKIQVMLVEDHLVMRNGMRAMLSMQTDIDVAGEASNGAEAVALARQIKPDIILMDINMPVMNGVDATRIIHSELPDIRIIGLSMYEAADQAGAMKQAGAAAYLSKSSSSDILLAAIRQYGKVGRNPKPVKTAGGVRA